MKIIAEKNAVSRKWYVGGRKMKDTVFICGGHFKQPTDTEECYEVIWSNGTACRRCPLKTCYRNGWLKKAVDADNKRLVANRAKVSA